MAIVDDFFDIIYSVHVEMDGRGGKHAGQKRTYRAVSKPLIKTCQVHSHPNETDESYLTFTRTFYISKKCLINESNRKTMNRNWCNQKANPTLKTKTGNKINITNRQNTMRTNCLPSGQLFPKRWPLSNPN